RRFEQWWAVGRHRGTNHAEDRWRSSGASGGQEQTTEEEINAHQLRPAMSRRYDFDEDEPYVVIEKQSGTLSSFFIGAAIGAGLALLFAPQSGARTRRDLQRRARRAQRTARKVANDVTDTVVDKFHDARRQVEQRIDSARQAIEVKKEQVHRAMEAGRAAAQQAREELERRIAESKAAYQTSGDSAPGTSAAPSRRAAATATSPREDEETEDA